MRRVESCETYIWVDRGVYPGVVVVVTRTGCQCVVITETSEPRGDRTQSVRGIYSWCRRKDIGVPQVASGPTPGSGGHGFGMTKG